MVKEKTLFDVLNAINNKTHIKYHKKIVSAYMIAMWLSHEQELLPIVNEINEILFRLDDEAIFRYFYDKIPKKRRFIKWTKKEKLKEKDEQMVDEIMKKFDASKEEAIKCLLN